MEKNEDLEQGWLKRQMEKARENLEKLPEDIRKKLEVRWERYLSTKPFQPKKEDH